MNIVVGYDAIGANVGHLPRGAQVAGYTTGLGDVPWTAADWAAHPGAVRIDQDPSATDPTADALDVENGAATFGDCAPWAKRALAAFHEAARPGQRSPVIYASASNISAVANALIAGGVVSGIGLWVANWNLSEPQAVADVENARGPFPIDAVQFKSGALYDTDIFGGAWLANVSGVAHTNGFPHFADGTTDWGTYSAQRGMQPMRFLGEQFKLHPQDADNLLFGMVPAQGARYWTENP